jgi:hypothetical protein
MAPGDVARALDLLTNYLFADMRTHPDDVTEMKLIANRIRMWSTCSSSPPPPTMRFFMAQRVAGGRQRSLARLHWSCH